MLGLTVFGQFPGLSGVDGLVEILDLAPGDIKGFGKLKIIHESGVSFVASFGF